MAAALLEQKNRIPSKVSTELIAFADCLVPSKSYIAEGKERVQDVFSALQREAYLFVSRSYISGSVGKSTSVIYPDFDCVVFLNNKFPPHTDMVKDFEKKLREKASTLKIIVGSLKAASSMTLSLQFTNGVEMDLLPATSFAQKPEDQYREVLKKMSETEAKLIMGYSSSLAETVLQFMRSQSGTVHQLVRLAKYWYKLCTIDVHVYGGSSIIEILCVDVANDLDPVKESEGKTFLMVQGFIEFLKKVSVIDTLKIAFYYENGKFVRVPPKELTLPKYKGHFQQRILSRKNFIIEPANPFNDLATNIKPDALKRLKDFSKKMITRLEKLESMQSNEIKTLSSDGKDVQLVHYDKLFEPFIMCLKDYYPAAAIPTYICVDYFYQNYNVPHEIPEIRQAGSDIFKKNPGAKNVYKTVMKNLLFLIRGKAQRTLNKASSFTDGVVDIEKSDDVRSVVKKFIDANFGVSKFIKESQSTKDHQDYHVTVSIPYRRMVRGGGEKGCIHAVRFSMKWNA